jgi:uncharacterized protein YcfL
MKIPAILAATALLILTAGCQQTVNTVQRAEPQARPAVIQDKRVVTDRSLAETVQVVNVIETVVSGDLRKVQVTVTNNRSVARNFNYRFEWYDQDGMLVRTPGPWKNQRIQGRETVPLSDVAPNPRAVDFILKLQEPGMR